MRSDDQLSRQRDREFDLGGRLLPDRIGLCRLLPEFHGLARAVLIVAIVGIAAYLAFLVTVDVPMYLAAGVPGSRRRQVAGASRRSARCQHAMGGDARFRRWKDEIAWMSLYFSAAVWAARSVLPIRSTSSAALSRPCRER